MNPPITLQDQRRIFTKASLWGLLAVVVLTVLVVHILVWIFSAPSQASIKAKFWKPYQKVSIMSTIDSTDQPAYVYQSTKRKMPLIVSLHSWSADYTQKDPVAEEVRKRNWNYIHPDFRGPNKNYTACASQLAFSDIEDAIQFAIDSFDAGKVYVVGGSGGGFAALVHALNTRHNIEAYSVWNPMTDLGAWYQQSTVRGNHFAKDILNCTSPTGTYDLYSMQQRSPLFMDAPANFKPRISIYTGVYDGVTGPVPISHSINFYNRFVGYTHDQSVLVSEDAMVALLSHDYHMLDPYFYIDSRAVVLHKSYANLSITIFDGTHEMLSPEVILRDLVQ